VYQCTSACKRGGLWTAARPQRLPLINPAGLRLSVCSIVLLIFVSWAWWLIPVSPHDPQSTSRSAWIVSACRTPSARAARRSPALSLETFLSVLGPVTGVYTSEIFPLQVYALGFVVSTALPAAYLHGLPVSLDGHYHRRQLLPLIRHRHGRVDFLPRLPSGDLRSLAR
jgi:hypothetical protein